MIVEVHHQPFGTPNTSWTHVATVNATRHATTVEQALDFAYRWTQNIDGSWSKYGSPDWHEDVTLRAELPVHQGRTLGLRSSMVGDRFVIDGKTYVCAAFGFKELTDA